MKKFLEIVKFWWSKTNRWHRALFIFLVVELRFIPAGQYGFYCNDPALSHPFTGDTISWKWLIAVSASIPLVIMFLVERAYYPKDKDRCRRRALKWYKEYMFGFLLNLTLIELIKLIVGSPRPHFFDTCRPVEAETCEDSEFVKSYKCTEGHWLKQSDRSFPSGHTSIALHAAFFIVYYLRKRIPHPSPPILAAQAIVASSAIYCAISRITDHRHHWWDVAFAAALAIVVLGYTIWSLCQNFDCSAEELHKLNKEDGTSASNGLLESTSKLESPVKKIT